MFVRQSDGIPIPDGSECFICSYKVGPLRVEWIGLKGRATIYLHPRCADYMATALKRDSLEALIDKGVADEWYAKYRRQPPDEKKSPK